jgi:hypothetical protein
VFSFHLQAVTKFGRVGEIFVMIGARSEILRKEQRRFLGRFQRLLYQQFSVHVLEVDVTNAIAVFFSVLKVSPPPYIR